MLKITLIGNKFVFFKKKIYFCVLLQSRQANAHSRAMYCKAEIRHILQSGYKDILQKRYIAKRIQTRRQTIE